MIQSIQSEFTRYRRLAELAFERLDDEQLHLPLGSDENSIAVLIQHLGNNLNSRFTDFLTSDGEKDWRNRDGEFVEQRRTRAQLLEIWDGGWRRLESSLATLTPSDLERDVSIRQVALRVDAALLRSLAHAAYHCGQIVQLARHLVGQSWESLSVPRGGSLAYARNPTRERSPDGTR